MKTFDNIEISVSDSMEGYAELQPSVGKRRSKRGVVDFDSLLEQARAGLKK